MPNWAPLYRVSLEAAARRTALESRPARIVRRADRTFHPIRVGGVKGGAEEPKLGRVERAVAHGAQLRH